MMLRWRLRADTPDALFERGEVVAGRGAYRGIEFFEVEARQLINRLPAGTTLPFSHTINVYRGCSHACVYCFARPTHDFLGLGMGRDFETKIVVKVNAPGLARAETDPGRWSGHPIAMGTNTDPYQPAEGKYKLTQGVVEVLADRRNPFSILTKSPLVLRDLDLLTRAAGDGEVRVDLSIGTLDEEVWRKTEPGAPHPRRRVEALARLREAGIRAGVLVAPVLPGISDHPEQLRAVVEACAAAGATFVAPIHLHLRPGVREHYLTWLDEHYPHLAAGYRSLYGEGPYAPSRQRALAARVAALAAETGMESPPRSDRNGPGRGRRPRQLRLDL